MKTMMIGAATVLAMLSGQAMAATAPTNSAASLSVSKSVRAGTPTTKKSKALAGTGAIVVGVLAAGAVVGGVLLIADDDDSDSN